MMFPIVSFIFSLMLDRNRVGHETSQFKKNRFFIISNSWNLKTHIVLLISLLSRRSYESLNITQTILSVFFWGHPVFSFFLFLAFSHICSLIIQITLLSKPQPQPNLNTTVGFDTKMTLQTPPHPTTPPHHRNFSGTSRRPRELKFGTDTH